MYPAQRRTRQARFGAKVPPLSNAWRLGSAGESTLRVPVFNLERARDRIEKDLLVRWQDLLANTAFVLGEEVAEFERSFARYVGAAACVGVGNGTDALTLALKALGIGPGDEVLVPAFTFFATYESVALAGATPVLVDVEPGTLLLDLAAAEASVSERTRALVGVHLYGLPMNGPAVDDFCLEHGILWVEDAAQAHGASIVSADGQERAAGTLGRAASWSFYPSKNLGCFGDGGAVTSGDPEVVARVRSLANHGQIGRYLHGEIGTNSRLDALQAAVLHCRLALLDEANRSRTSIVKRYREAFNGQPGLTLLDEPAYARSAHHLFVLRSSHRDALQNHLAEAGIGSAVHYPRTVADQPAVAEAHRGQSFPAASRAATEVLALPLFPELEAAEVDAVIEGVLAFKR